MIWQLMSETYTWVNMGQHIHGSSSFSRDDSLKYRFQYGKTLKLYASSYLWQNQASKLENRDDIKVCGQHILSTILDAPKERKKNHAWYVQNKCFDFLPLIRLHYNMCVCDIKLLSGQKFLKTIKYMNNTYVFIIE